MLRRHWRTLLLVYAALLLASNLTRLASVDANARASVGGLQFVMLEASGRPVRLAYRDEGPRDAPPVVLLHGSPSPGGFDAFVPTLRDEYRVVVPHLPGFGASSRRVDDYSIRAHARHVLALLDRLGVASAHVAGYSMGGGVAIEMAAQAPQRVRSLSLISSIGVQELEMFGNYHLNRAVHALQLVLFRALEWGVPHFGLLDRTMLNARYARNFYDTDQRPLRAALARLTMPVLIVHGRGDTLVPFAAAREHHRIVPHSELVALDGGHMLVFTRSAELAGHVAQAVMRAERGLAPHRAQAAPERVRLAAEPFSDHHDAALTGVALALALLALALATLVSEDAACIGGGLLVAAGVAPFWPVTIACLLGIYFGDAALWWLGRHLGTPALSRAPLKWFVNEKGLRGAQAWFERRGAAAILISRFVPGTRFPTYVSAGALGTPFWRFSGWFLLAAVLWTPALVALAAWFGEAMWRFFARFSEYALPALIASAAVVYVAVHFVLPLTNFRGRRLLLGRWRRLTRWEYWPRWAFYPPIVLYVLWLGVRFRCLTLFTAANPAMPDGGFVGESKGDILDALVHAGDFLAQTERLPGGPASARAEAVATFMQRHALGWPVVLKPDVGERGKDILIARGAAEVRTWLAAHPEPALVQAFAPGHEFGVFYVRHPDEARGRVFGITDKRPPSVTGDGRRTLERLILSDARAVCMAPTFLDRFADRLYDVPAAGETVPLVEIGTHSQGCEFLDGEWLRSAALEARIDAISRGYEGFFFGRYDLRTPDLDDLRRGENFKIVELNGVTSEATNLYDPSHSLWQAYAILMRQWRLAFEIGQANRERGAPVTPALELLRRAIAPRGAAISSGVRAS